PGWPAGGGGARLALGGRLGWGAPPWLARLTSGSAVTRQAVTKHLHVLAGAGLVRDVRQGRERIWALESEHLEDARRFLDRVSQGWDDALARLRKHVEE